MCVSENLQQYIGNNLKLNLTSDKCLNYIIMGNNSSVLVKYNLGTIKLIGNNNVLRIICGNGTVQCTGNNNNVALGQAISKGVVTFIGQNCDISQIDGEKPTNCRNKTTTNNTTIFIKDCNGIQISKNDLNCYINGEIRTPQNKSS